MTETGPAFKAGEEGKRKGCGKGEEKEGFTKSLLRTKCYSFINSHKYKKDISVYDALKSHRRKKETNSTHFLTELPLKKKEADKC